MIIGGSIFGRQTIRDSLGSQIVETPTRGCGEGGNDGKEEGSHANSTIKDTGCELCDTCLDCKFDDYCHKYEKAYGIDKGRPQQEKKK